jgi:hypothetical protein
MKQRGRKSQYDAYGNTQPRQRAFKIVEPPPPPAHLAEPERALWASAVADFDLESDTALAVLTTGLEAHMRIAEIRHQIAVDGLTILDKFGQIKIHPLLAAERDARAGWLAAVKALGLLGLEQS